METSIFDKANGELDDPIRLLLVLRVEFLNDNRINKYPLVTWLSYQSLGISDFGNVLERLDDRN